MFSKKLLFAVVCILSTNRVWASSDFSCEPKWTLNQNGYDSCSNLPILAPSNDTRINLKLLLVDNGFATLQTNTLTNDVVESGYGKVPFSVDIFESRLFLSQAASSDNEDTAVSYGGGTRCISNDAGKADFIAALEQSKDVSAAERKLLAEERQKLNPSCVDVSASKSSDNVSVSTINANNITSPTGKQFMQYLIAATAFYEGHYNVAGYNFAGLKKSDQPWLKETARYMLGRTELNLAQQSAFDSDGFPELTKVDKKALLSAEVKFNDYLKEYPSGRYASSARGLLRRVYWLSNQPQKLVAEYEWQLNNAASPQHNLSLNDLVNEADSKLLGAADPKQINNPILLATIDLLLMRSADSSSTKQISISDLKKQQPIFSQHKALFEYLLAVHQFYVQKDAANTVKALPDAIPQKMTYLDFSRLMLRGQALEATKDSPGARKLWLSLLPVSGQPLQGETLQLALALNYEHSSELGLAFAPDSPITESQIRNILLRNGASADLLRQIAKAKNSSGEERNLAIYTLLYKDLLQGHYQNYIDDYPLLSSAVSKQTHAPEMDGHRPLEIFTWTGKKSTDSYGCPSTLGIAQILAKNAQDPYGLICLGDFVNTNDLESGFSVRAYSVQKISDVTTAVLGSAPSHFPGKTFSRGEGYKTVIADANAAPDLKAYALYRSIKCYATSGYNHCSDDNVEKSVRKSWFQSLKTHYPNTTWAKSLKYYW